MPEVEISPLRACTSVETLERGSKENEDILNRLNKQFQFVVRQFLEKMGQIAFFRSGNEPIVLNEQQRNSRKEGTHFYFCVRCYIITNISHSSHGQLASNS